tara:strand:+ start:1185 stop:1856 length:672 start_codon:yes stop_codon:yes gene_type:complete
MHQTKSKKIFFYFFLLITLGSINNISLNNIKIDKIKKISITGLNESEKKIILEDLKKLNLDNIFFLNVNEIRNLMNSNSIIENYKIFKLYPSTLDIKIKKTTFLAQINIKGKIFLIGANGKLSEKNFSNEYLPFVFGKPKIEDFFLIKEIIDRSTISYKDVKSLYYFKSKRWDIELKNNTLIKLSENYTKQSLEDSIIFLNSNKFENIKIIDARVKNQIIIND